MSSQRVNKSKDGRKKHPQAISEKGCLGCGVVGLLAVAPPPVVGQLVTDVSKETFSGWVTPVGYFSETSITAYHTTRCHSPGGV